MSEVKTAYGLAQYVSDPDTIKVGKNGTPAKKLTYTRLDGDQKGKSQSVQWLVGNLDDASREVLMKAKETSGSFVVVKEKGATDEYYNFKSFADASTFVEKPASTWKPGGAKAGGYSKPAYDDTGVKVGAARNQAIAILAATKGGRFGLDDVDNLAYDIVARQAAMEANVRKGTSPTVGSFTQDLEPDDDLSF